MRDLHRSSGRLLGSGGLRLRTGSPRRAAGGPQHPGRMPIGKMVNELAPIFVVGYPGPVGGACTELWHTLKLWRGFGAEVHLIPTWGRPPDDWRQRCDAIGCVTHQANPNRDELAAIEGLAGGVVVSFCNELFLCEAKLFRDLGCRIVWSNCMNWIFDQERRHYALFGPFAAYHCQSDHQLRTLQPLLAQYGVRAEQFHRVPGAFDPDDFVFHPRPHADGETFVIGRLSRSSIDKFSTNTWPILNRVDYANKRYRLMGWTPEVGQTVGPAPVWAEMLPTAQEPVAAFLGSLHCYCQINGTATENWPRTGLEAMAAGVPIVVEARGGWPEMIEHRRTGFVCGSDAELAHWMANLAYHEAYRLEVIHNAWLHLVKHLSDPERIWEGWQELFQTVLQVKGKI